MKYLIVALVLFGCGRKPASIECSWSQENTATITVGNIEKAKCPEGEFILSINPQYLPGGEVTAILVQCAKRTQNCHVVQP